MNVLGLDSGGRYNGLAYGSVSKGKIQRVELNMRPFTTPSPDKLVQAAEFAEQWITGLKPDCVVAENYAFGGNNFNREVPEVFGVFKMTFHRHKVPLILVPPSSAKKAVTGSGKATKSEVQKAAKAYVIDKKVDVVLEPLSRELQSHPYDALALIIALVQAEDGSPIKRDLRIVGEFYGIDLLGALHE